jgi:hypothetical protein
MALAIQLGTNPSSSKEEDVMAAVPTNVLIHEIDVTFDPQSGVTLGDSGFEVTNLLLAQGIHMIRFRLTNAATDVIFPSSPVLWVEEDGGTALQPPGMMVYWHDAKEAALVVFNAVGFQRTFRFRVMVNVEQEIFSSSDPTIICDPPGS